MSLQEDSADEWTGHGCGSELIAANKLFIELMMMKRKINVCAIYIIHFGASAVDHQAN